ncbi:MAG: hypothetical protein KF749_14375 [Bacteroidetes bacterium]|nr:hypothetical protein [Bacteroidota bacterium]MCW5895688.1 hypothetical protein [Bacteroidota bacterium]
MKELTEYEHTLLAKAVDGDLTRKENNELQKLLAAHPALQKELTTMKRLKEMTMEMEFKKPPEETWDRYWAGVYARMERGFAWLLITVGATLLAGFAIHQWMVKVLINGLLRDTDVPLYVTIGVAAASLGLAVLLVSVLREQLISRKSDKYRKVIR